MKELILLTVVCIFIGSRSRSLRWPQLVLIGLFVGMLVFWQTSNILFRYIGVE